MSDRPNIDTMSKEELRKALIEQDKRVDEFLQHCEDSECHTCSAIICPNHDPLHFHHDGCPSCDL